MKFLAVLAFVTVFVAVACKPAVVESSSVDASKVAYLPDNRDEGVYLIHGPDQYGVVCYARYVGGSSLSCVKVR